MKPNLVALAFAACVALALPACARNQDTAAADAAGDDTASLPKPEAGAGSVTGMPDTPGPGAIGPPPSADDGVVLPPDTAVASDGSVLTPVEGDVAPGAGMQPGNSGDTQATPPMAVEPTPDDAVAVIRSYYAAIAARQYARAHALWSGGGSASGQSPEQFAAGFAGTMQVQVEPGAPGRVEPAAGSRFIEIPVSIQATRDDGSVHRYIGTYTLRRAVVDGASAEQRAWRIASADLREVR